MPLARMPDTQAIINTTGRLREKMEPMTAGTIRKLKTSRTPAVVTELVTTTPNVRKKKKSQIDTATGLKAAAAPAPEIAIRGRRTSQCKPPISP